MDVILVYVNTPTAAEARRIGRALVEARLVAAANVVPGMRSIYRWEGRVREHDEAMLVAKTRAGLVDAAIETASSLHSYERPAILAVPVRGGDPGYLDWVVASVVPDGSAGTEERKK
jgi:periplasmic divalent cation tolerance protein